jgi:hypothetical protein
MRGRGLIRLWIVMSALFVPGLAFWAVNDNINTWAELDKITIQTCVNEEGKPNFDVDKCVHDAGADQTMFQHEHTTPGRYWAEALGFAFLFDLIVTALLVGALLVGRWVVQGFRTGTS